MYSSVTTEPRSIATPTRWSEARTLALPGHCRGVVLARWAENLARHFGARGVDRVREALPTWARDLPDDPPDDAWFPVGLQLRITEVVIETLLGGDASALEPLLHDDVRRSISRTTLMFLRTVGPTPILGRAKQIHPSLYDVGRVRADVGSGRAAIHCTGGALFGHPTWAMLQRFAHRGFVELTGRDVTQLEITQHGDDAARIDVAWR